MECENQGRPGSRRSTRNIEDVGHCPHFTESAWMNHLACRLAEWVAFLHAVIIATVVICRVRNPACTARERPRVGALYKWNRSIKKCFHIPFGYKRHSKYRLNTNKQIQTKNHWLCYGFILHRLESREE